MSTLFLCRNAYKILQLQTARGVTCKQFKFTSFSLALQSSNFHAISSSSCCCCCHCQTLLQANSITSLSLASTTTSISKKHLLASYSTTFNKYQIVMDAPAGVFRGLVDRFNGITIDSEQEYAASDNFSEKLKKSLDYWLTQKRRAIWFKVHTKHAEWIPHLTMANFEFHHVQNDALHLFTWLPEEESVNIPSFAHTMIGVGGLVVNDKQEVLVVCDRFALIPNSWKLPGGYVEPSENFIDAAVREVREETGIETKFKTMISVRHSHGGNFDCSDIYIVIGLTPLNSEIQRCEREIADIKWMPVHEYLQHPHVHETNRHFMRTYLDYEQRGIQLTCEFAKHRILKKDYCLYYAQSAEKALEIEQQNQKLQSNEAKNVDETQEK